MRSNQSNLIESAEAAAPQWCSQQRLTFGPRLLQTICKTIPLISQLSLDRIDANQIEATIVCSAPLPKRTSAKIAEVVAAACGLSTRIHSKVVGISSQNGYAAHSPPNWRICPPREFCDSINAFDSREIDLAVESLCQIEPANAEQIDQVIQSFHTRLEEIDQLIGIKVDAQAKTLSLQLDITIERAIDLEYSALFTNVANALPANWNVLIEALRYEAIKRVEPQLPITFQDDVHRELVRSSLTSALASCLPAFEIHDRTDGFEVLVPLHTLPQYCVQDLEHLLTQFGVPIILHDSKVPVRHLSARDLPGIVNFLLPEGIFFHHLRENCESTCIYARRYRSTTVPTGLISQIELALQRPLSIATDIIGKPLEDVMRSSGRGLQTVLARVANSDAIVTARYQELRDIVVDTLFQTDRIRIREPNAAQLNLYPKLKKEFVALGSLNSLHEDAFCIERTYDGFRLDVALIDGSAFVPHELGLNDTLKTSFSSAYCDQERLDFLPRDQIEAHAGYKIGEYRPSVVVTFHITPEGEMIDPPTIKLASVSIAAEFDRYNFNQAVDNPEVGVELQCQLFDRFSRVLREKRLDLGGLIWRNPAGEVFESQLLVNHFLSDFAAKRSIPYLYRVLDTPTVEERKNYADDIYAQFGGYIPDVSKELPAHTYNNDRKFRRYLQSVSRTMTNREIKELCWLLRNRHYFDTDSNKTDFFQLGKRYSQSSGSLRYFPALINIGQISRHLRGEPLYDQAAMERFASDSSQIQYDSRTLSRLLSCQSLVGEAVVAEVSPNRREARAQAAPGLPINLVDANLDRIILDLHAPTTRSIEVIGYDLKKNRAIARISESDQP